MATNWNITADSTPVLDGWGWADYWPIGTWVQWHGLMKAKYGQAEANRRFLEVWHTQDSDANPFNERSINAQFRQYARDNGFYDGLYTGGLGFVAKPLGWLTDLFTTADKVEANSNDALLNTSKGIKSSGKILKIAVPTAVIIILLFGIFYLYNRTK